MDNNKKKKERIRISGKTNLTNRNKTLDKIKLLILFLILLCCVGICISTYHAQSRIHHSTKPLDLVNSNQDMRQFRIFIEEVESCYYGISDDCVSVYFCVRCGSQLWKRYCTGKKMYCYCRNRGCRAGFLIENKQRGGIPK